MASQAVPIYNLTEDDPPEDASNQLLPVTRRKQCQVLISSFLTICITIGFNQAYGVFQGYYVSDEARILPPSQAKDGAMVAFIGTLGTGLTWGGSIVVNPLMARIKDKRYITVSGVLIMSLGFGLASCATQVSLRSRNEEQGTEIDDGPVVASATDAGLIVRDRLLDDVLSHPQRLPGVL